MLNYMRAEFYKVLRRKYLYVTELVLLLCAALIVAGWAFTNSHGNRVEFYTGAVMSVTLLSIGLYLTLLVTDFVFSDQYKFNTLKNEVSFGISRSRIYLGKLLVEMLMGVVMAVLLVAFYVGLCYITLLPSDGEETKLALEIIGYCVFNALPQWLGVVAMTHAVYFLIRSNTVAAFLAAGIIAVPGPVLELVTLVTGMSENVRSACILLNSWLPVNMIGNAFNVVGDWSYVAKSWVIGGVWIVVSTAIGLTAFHRKEIN